jgi:hypothetical protein
MAEKEISTRRTRNFPVRLVLLGLVAVASVALGFLTFNAGQSRIYVQRYGYYTISFTFVWAIFAWARVAPGLRAEWQGISVRDRWTALAIIAASTLVALATVPMNYKVLYDEMVVQATAWQMHFYREVNTLLRGYHVDGVLAPLDTYLDKRPFFFAYVLSLVHDVTGYREENAFALNVALLPVSLLQVFVLARRVAKQPGALAALIALGTLSLLAHNGTGAGIELLNLVMLLLTMQLALMYLEAPDGPRLSALVLSAVLLAQTRYESSLYVGSVALVTAEGWRRAGRFILPPAAIFGPALLIPYALHNTYLSGTPLLWELSEDAAARFGLAHAWSNLQHAWRFFFNFSSTLTNSWWLSIAGFAAFFFCLATLWRHRRDWRQASPTVVALIFFGLAIVGNLSLLMCYYWGQLDDPIVARLSLPFSVLLALSLAYTVDRLNAPRRKLGWVAAGGAMVAYLSSGLAANAQHTGLNTLEHELTWERRVIEARPPGERLILTNKSSLPWLLRDCSAILLTNVRGRADALRFHLEKGTFVEVLVLQRYLSMGAEGGFQLDPHDRLPDSWILEPVQERRIGARLARISRLTQILPEAPTPAAAGAK